MSPLAKTNQLLSASHVISLRIVETNDTKKYSSISSAPREFRVNHATLLYYTNKGKLFKGKYNIKREM